jgi:hypothetical protein
MLRHDDPQKPQPDRPVKMPFDSFPERFPSDGDPYWHQCRSCKQPIAAHQPMEKIQLPHDPVHGADMVNGTYHAECARPYLSLVNALNALSRLG